MRTAFAAFAFLLAIILASAPPLVAASPVFLVAAAGLPSIKNGEYVTLIEATKLIPGRPSLGAVRRYCEKGYRGIVLESWRVCGKRVTTVQAIEEFIAATNAAHKVNPQRNSLDKARAAKAKALLDAAGV